MALSREDKADVKGAMGKALANKVSHVTKDKYWERKDKEFGADKRKYLAGDKEEHKKVSDSLHAKLSKSQALSEKTGKKSLIHGVKDFEKVRKLKTGMSTVEHLEKASKYAAK